MVKVGRESSIALIPSCSESFDNLLLLNLRKQMSSSIGRLTSNNVALQMSLFIQRSFVMHGWLVTRTKGWLIYPGDTGRKEPLIGDHPAPNIYRL